MKKLIAFAIVTLSAMPASAQSAKYSMQLGTITKLGKAQIANVGGIGPGKYVGPWTTILDTNIKTSAQKDLTIGVSLESALVTDTSVASSKYRSDTSTAEAAIEVRVFVDDDDAYPGPVVFARRLQSLMAKFDGFSCVDALTVDTNGDGTPDAGDGIVQYDECTWTDEEVALLQETMNANAFFFALDDVGTGVHPVKVEARLIVDATSETGAAKAAAWVGKGALTVEEVRLVKGQDITIQ